MAGFFGGMAQGLTQGVSTGAQLRNQREIAGLRRAQNERAQQVHDQQMAEHQRAQMQRTARDFYGAMQSGDEAMATRIVQQNPEVFRAALHLNEKRHPIGAAQVSDDGEWSLLIGSEHTGTAGLWTQDGQPSAQAEDQVLGFRPEDVARFAGIEAPEPDLEWREGVYFDKRTGDPVADHREMMSQGSQFSEPMRHEELGWVQRGPDGRLYQLDAPGASGTGAGGAGLDLTPGSTDYNRIYDTLGQQVNNYVRRQVGEEFIGDPNVAHVESWARDAALNVYRQEAEAGHLMPPHEVGNAAARLAFSGDYPLLHPQRAMEAAAEQIDQERKEAGEGRMSRRHVDEEAVQARAQQIQAQEAERLRAELAQMYAGQGAGRQAPGQQMTPGGQQMFAGQQAEQGPGAADALPYRDQRTGLSFGEGMAGGPILPRDQLGMGLERPETISNNPVRVNDSAAVQARNRALDAVGDSMQTARDYYTDPDGMYQRNTAGLREGIGKAGDAWWRGYETVEGVRQNVAGLFQRRAEAPPEDVAATIEEVVQGRTPSRDALGKTIRWALEHEDQVDAALMRRLRELARRTMERAE
ncbi:hypothetical protein [Halorhodospira sp. 9622]|uniref:hypothetical protein n=1 Tax=Halorhodospira sp. 9622 TaxID=2899136 RepID=UPI001EE7FD59|nr:hypothetical protein [Halorhodospira sp. 9622]MCG5537852.1 hypothetical protein [Halorhodospira sp. 9622]